MFVFLDLFKAFDSVWHQGLFYKLYQCGIRGFTYKAIVDLYTEMKSCVKYNGCTSEWFPVLQGTRQGGYFPHFCSQFLLMSYWLFLDHLA